MMKESAPVAAWAWGILVAATLLARLLAEDARDPRLATTLVLLIASFKVRIVVGSFMEVRWSARPWRSILEGWIAGVTLVILVGYWITPS